MQNQRKGDLTESKVTERKVSAQIFQWYKPQAGARFVPPGVIQRLGRPVHNARDISARSMHTLSAHHVYSNADKTLDSWTRTFPCSDYFTDVGSQLYVNHCL